MIKSLILALSLAGFVASAGADETATRATDETSPAQAEQSATSQEPATHEAAKKKAKKKVAKKKKPKKKHHG